MLYSSKSKYLCSNDGVLTWWNHLVNKSLHNLINLISWLLIKPIYTYMSA